jgi:hypothetical protein
MKRLMAGALAGVTALIVTAGCSEQVRQLEPKLELKKAAENLGASGKVGLTLKTGGNVEDLIALAKKESGTGKDAFTDEDADILRKVYNSSFTIAWDKAGNGVDDDMALINATIDGVTGAEIRVIDKVAYVKVPVAELAAKFGVSTADIRSFQRETDSAIPGISTLLNGGWVSVAAADVEKLGKGSTGVAPSADPAQNERLAAELKTSAERLLDGAQVVRDDKDKTHLVVTTTTVKAYEEAKRLVGAMEKVAGEAASGTLSETFGARLEKPPADKPIVVDLWVDNGNFKAFELNVLQFVEGNTGRATLRVDISTGADITAPDGATKLDLSKFSKSIGSAGSGTAGDAAETWARSVGSHAVLLAMTEGGKPARHLKKAAARMAVPGVTVKVVRRGVAEVTSGDSVACVTVPATTSGKPKVAEGAC